MAAKVDTRPLTPKGESRAKDPGRDPMLETTVELAKPGHARLAQPAPWGGHAEAPPRGVRIVRDGARELALSLYPDRPLLLGRDPKCTVVFPSAAVSREHARLWVREDGLWVIRDLGSRNGSSLLRSSSGPGGDYRPLKAGEDTPVGAGDVVLLAGGANWLQLEANAAERSAGSLSARSEASRLLEESLRICSRHRLPVFLIGPSGSGKTHLARMIHEASGQGGHFILVNCGRLPTDPVQLQSELLGHHKGAFTGAVADRVGKFHAADGGTLFLDEVEHLPLVAQDFLIDLLDGSGSFAPLGAPANRRWPPPKVRLIAASKRTLARSGLRPDLCQRLAAADVIPLPTMEQRREDIPGLVEEFLAQFSREQAIRADIEPDAVALLQAEAWPGQVRELEAAVKVTAAREYARQSEDVAAEGLLITSAALRQHLANRRLGFGTPAPGAPEHHAQHLADADLPPTVQVATLSRKRPRDLTATELAAALAKHGGNKTRAASELGIAVNTLKERMRSFGLLD
jgi:DNA-binding NtrC family response regulator